MKHLAKISLFFLASLFCACDDSGSSTAAEDSSTSEIT